MVYAWTPSLRGLGRLQSIQGLASAMSHGMAGKPHGIGFSFLSFSLVRLDLKGTAMQPCVTTNRNRHPHMLLNNSYEMLLVTSVMGAKVTQTLQASHTDGMLTCNRWRNVDGRGCASCLFDSLLDRAKHWQIEMRLACLLGIDSPDHLCAILDGLCVQHCDDQLATTKVCDGKPLQAKL